ncbi:MAG TPA: pyridoxal 5'-phosphate synthase glutaminase subunit PdxT, partial [Chloroflexia bacterium]|nr:pyridoxal 5'-phosphate synthase glutaminase subunit PdxT [Chloroflexia bacterium]
QGAFREHGAAIRALGATPVEVRLPEHLADVAGLIIPGGESTTIGKLAALYGLDTAIRRFNQEQGRPVYGTCAGMIYVARDAGRPQPVLGLIDVAVERNAFGRQIDSFETALPIAALGAPPFPAVFIRAPLIGSVGPGVQVLARLADGRPVAAQQGRVLVTAFHPELTGDLRIHRYFLEQCAAAAADSGAGEARRKTA